MKKIIFILLITFVLLTGTVVYSEELNNDLMGKRIVIDVGHGGKDSGTSVNNILEKDLNLIISLKLREKLIKHGVDVIMTRDDDFDLSSPNVSRRKKSDFDNRIKLINNSLADLYLSIHMNYLGNSKYYGAQVFYTEGNEVIAEFLQKEFQSDLESPMKIKKLSDSIYMYKKLNVPGVLIECGFLSNDRERIKLMTDNYQDKLVDSIIDGLINYY